MFVNMLRILWLWCVVGILVVTSRGVLGRYDPHKHTVTDSNEFVSTYTDHTGYGNTMDDGMRAKSRGMMRLNVYFVVLSC